MSDVRWAEFNIFTRGVQQQNCSVVSIYYDCGGGGTRLVVSLFSVPLTALHHLLIGFFNFDVDKH